MFRLILATVAVLLATSSAHANRITITTTTSPPSARVVSFDELKVMRFDLDVDMANGTVELYPRKWTSAERAAGTCTLTVVNNVVSVDLANLPTEPCRAALLPLVENRSLDLAVSKAGTFEFGVLSYEPPSAYKGKDPSVIVDMSVDTDNLQNDRLPKMDTASVPAHVTIKSNDCFLVLDRLRKGTCDATSRTVSFAEPELSMVTARLAQEQTLSLIVLVTDGGSEKAWRTIPLKPREKAKPKDPAPQPGAPTGSLAERCLAARPPRSGTAYLICVDAFRTRRGVVTYECKGADVGTCAPAGDLLEVNRNFVVTVFSPKDLQIDVTLGGSAGRSSTISGEAKVVGLDRVDASSFEVTTWDFSPRRVGTADLEVKLLKDDDDTGVAPSYVEVKKTFTIEPVYKAAIRLGLGFVWMPGASEVGIRSTSDNQRYVEVTDEDLFKLEAMAGYTVFLKPLKENSFDFTFGVGIRFGLLSTAGSDLKVLTSAMIGPEFCFGPDFSVGVFYGVVRHPVPSAGYEPGTTIPANVQAIETDDSAAFGYAVAFNFTPGFLKFAGVIK